MWKLIYIYPTCRNVSSHEYTYISSLKVGKCLGSSTLRLIAMNSSSFYA